MKRSGALCVLLELFNCFSRKKWLGGVESYTELPVKYTRTLKKRFPCLIFGAKISDLLSKYGKASSIAGEFGDARAFVQLLQ